MYLYWLAPILCGALGFGLSFLVKRYISKLSQTKLLDNLLLSDKIVQAIDDGIGRKIVELTQDTRTIQEVVDSYIGKEERIVAIDNSSRKLAGIITLELKESQISSIILEEIKRVLVEKIKLGFITGLMNGNIWETVEEPMKKAIDNYLDEKCQPMVEEKIKERLITLSQKRMYDLGELLLENRQKITDVSLEIYKNNISDLTNQILTQIGPVDEVLHKQLLLMQIGLTGFGVISALLSMLLLVF